MSTMRQAIKDIADAIRAKGVSGTMSLQQMPQKVDTMRTKYGMTIGSWIGDVDANGVLQPPSESSEFNAPEIVSLYNATFNTFQNKSSITKVSFPNLTTVDSLSYFCNGMANLTEFSAPNLATAGSGVQQLFRDCPNLVSIDLRGLQSIAQNGGSYLAANCTSLTHVDLGALTSLGNSALEHAFAGCTSLARVDYTANTNVDLGSLTSLPQSGLSYAFQGCTGLNYVDLSRIANANYNTVFSNTFNGCTSLVEVRLPEITAVKVQAFINTFYGCTSLRKVYLSKLSSASLRCWQNTFANCTSLELVDFSEATAVPAGNVGATTFTNAPSTFKIVVPDVLYSDWIAATGWSSAGVVEHIVKASEYMEE